MPFLWLMKNLEFTLTMNQGMVGVTGCTVHCPTAEDFFYISLPYKYMVKLASASDLIWDGTM